MYSPKIKGLDNYFDILENRLHQGDCVVYFSSDQPVIGIILELKPRCSHRFAMSHDHRMVLKVLHKNGKTSSRDIIWNQQCLRIPDKKLSYNNRRWLIKQRKELASKISLEVQEYWLDETWSNHW